LIEWNNLLKDHRWTEHSAKIIPAKTPANPRVKPLDAKKYH
jgi:hypothetical protein